MFVMRQLAAAAEQHALPARYKHAECSRAKVIDLAGNATRPRELVAPPEQLLEQAIQQLEVARFSVETDFTSAKRMLLHFDWLVKVALQQAQLDPRINTTDPNLVSSNSADWSQWFHGVRSSLSHRLAGMIHSVHNMQISLHGQLASARVYTTTQSSPRDGSGLSLADLHTEGDAAAAEGSEYDASTTEDSRDQIFDQQLES